MRKQQRTFRKTPFPEEFITQLEDNGIDYDHFIWLMNGNDRAVACSAATRHRVLSRLFFLGLKPQANT